ncbi:hypothetical protein [Parabacteroides provencensis]|uniref:hypothetical protein n=1 Tax=Parabacteroides provencensis TaxID=1944636 RepID=UPI000C14C6BF|nr:hypothetical protein [Parabacteroides provencensis]
MKKILLVLMLFCSITIFAQEKQKKTSLFGPGPYKVIQTKKATKNKQSLQEQTSGLLLQKASKEFITAGCTGIASGIFCGTSAFIDQKGGQYAMLGIGGVCGIVAIVYGFKGAITIGKAGKVHDQEKGFAYLKPANEGIGINLTF